MKYSALMSGLLVSAVAGLALAPVALAAPGYLQTNLVSDQAGVALLTDPNLVDAWGLAASTSSPFWSANNGTGTSTLYTSTSATGASINALVVTVPGVSGNAPVTGVVFNTGATGSFPVGGTTKASFIFAAEDGTISGWNSSVVTTAQIKVTTAGASYKGLAIANNGADHLYAADFAHGTINVFDATYASATLAGTFTDPSLPANYAPFNIRPIGSTLYVTYALRGNTGDDVAGPGNGIVDTYDLNGNFLSRLVTGGNLNSPWGLALAPAGFGALSGDLLVGNFGNGEINAYNPATGTFLGAMSDPSGNPIVIDGLWSLVFGNGGSGGANGVLYFTAGPDGESHGLLGSIAAVPEPATLALFAMTPLILLRRRPA